MFETWIEESVAFTDEMQGYLLSRKEKKMEDKGIIELEKIQYGLYDFLSKASLMNMSIDRIDDFVADRIIYKIRGYLMGEKLREEKSILEVSYPCSCWQMFKKQYFPKWLLKKFPVKYETVRKKVEFKVYELYPKFSKVCPNDANGSFKIQMLEDELFDI